MNVMAEAHKAVKAVIANAPLGIKLNYRALLKAALTDMHRKNKMTPVEAFKADTLAKFEKRVLELNELIKTPIADKWIVVCGDEHPMPINFNSETNNFWSDVENATKWSSPQFARVNAQKVVNGNDQVGKVVLVSDHIKWDIEQLERLINNLK